MYAHIHEFIYNLNIEDRERKRIMIVVVDYQIIADRDHQQIEDQDHQVVVVLNLLRELEDWLAVKELLKL